MIKSMHTAAARVYHQHFDPGFRVLNFLFIDS